jgi:hypothetical protein
MVLRDAKAATTLLPACVEPRVPSMIRFSIFPWDGLSWVGSVSVWSELLISGRRFDPYTAHQNNQKVTHW